MKALYQPEGTTATLFAVVGNPWGLLALWLAVVNLAAFVMFGVDKWKAKRPGARRIPEQNLFLTAMAGGSIGAWLGMKVWHHKTLHKSFRFGIPIIFLCQVLLALGLFLYFRVIR